MGKSHVYYFCWHMWSLQDLLSRANIYLQLMPIIITITLYRCLWTATWHPQCSPLHFLFYVSWNKSTMTANGMVPHVLTNHFTCLSCKHASLLNDKDTWHGYVATSIACKISFVNDQLLWKCRIVIVNLSNNLFYHHLMMTIVMTVAVMLTLTVVCCHTNTANTVSVSYQIVTCRHFFYMYINILCIRIG